MNNIRNHVQLIGHLGADATTKKLEDGKLVANARLATNEVYKNSKGDKVTNTEWHNIRAWGKTAELMEQFFRKGREVAVMGKISYSSYKDKDGVMRYTTDIVLKEFTLFGKAEKAA